MREDQDSPVVLLPEDPGLDVPPGLPALDLAVAAAALLCSVPPGRAVEKAMAEYTLDSDAFVRDLLRSSAGPLSSGAWDAWPDLAVIASTFTTTLLADLAAELARAAGRSIATVRLGRRTIRVDRQRLHDRIVHELTRPRGRVLRRHLASPEEAARVADAVIESLTRRTDGPAA